MYGFKPQHARGKPVQNFAEGGIVHSIKGALGLRPRTPEELQAADAKRMATNREAAAAIAERNRKAQPAPQQQSAVSGYAGMSAMQRREKELGLKDGGRVEPRGFVSGKGTGTSDSIKARLSNGEYVLPADTVKAVGVEALDALRAATHAPVKHEQAKAARGFFVGGTPGGVDEEKRKSSFGDTAAVARDSSVTQVGGLANNSGADASRFAQVPAPIGTQPNRTPEPATPSAPQPAAQTDPAKVPLGQMHSTGARSGGQMLASGIESGARSFFDSFQKAPVPAAAPSAAAPAGMPGYKTDVQRGGGNVPAIDTATPTTAPTATAPPVPAAAPGPGEVTRVGNSYSGTNVSGDISINGQAPRNGGQVSAQNMAAADALAQRSQQESMSRVSAQQPAGFAPSGMTAPTVRHSGNDWQSRNELRNALVSASSITNNGGKWDNHGKGNVSPERAAYLAMVGTDNALRQAQPGVDVAAMRENAGIQREGMQQAGATTRTGMTEQGANSREAGRNALATDEFGLRREAAGFQTRAAKRLEDLQASYQSAKTPEERAAIAQRLRELQGKGEGNLRDNFMAVGGGQEWDTTANTMRNVPQRLVDLRSGQEMGGPKAPAAPAAAPGAAPAQPKNKAEYDALPKGAQYVKNGATYVKS